MCVELIPLSTQNSIFTKKRNADNANSFKTDIQMQISPI